MRKHGDYYSMITEHLGAISYYCRTFIRHRDMVKKFDRQRRDDLGFVTVKTQVDRYAEIDQDR